jgi:hypothetical protein
MPNEEVHSEISCMSDEGKMRSRLDMTNYMVSCKRQGEMSENF